MQGELLKLGIHVSKRTIQIYMRQLRARPSARETMRRARTDLARLILRRVRVGYQFGYP